MSDARYEAYRRFVQASPEADDGYLFDAPRARFLPEPGDALVLMPGATLSGAEHEAKVLLPGGQELSFPGVSRERLSAALGTLPGSYGSFTAKLGPATPAFMAQAFSRILFTPRAVLELEQQLPSLEIVRFPGSPYEVVRAYWRNMLAVRRRLAGQLAPSEGSEFRQLLLELHELALLGERQSSQRDSFYLPASRLGRKRATPGVLYEVATGLERRGGEWLLTSGARVSVPFLGGRHYWQLLAESVSELVALEEREVELDGLAYGRVVQARAEDEPRTASWFLPPRPLRAEHFEALRAELGRADRAAAGGDRAALLAALAGFHYRLVRLHPLPSANQSLAMSFVNERLSRALGVGIPHLLLDQLALRFGPEAYARLFARAVHAWNAPFPNAADRLRQLMTMRNALNGLVSALAGSPSLLEARSLAAQREHEVASGLALLTGP
jgi:hypothetical protein